MARPINTTQSTRDANAKTKQVAEGYINFYVELPDGQAVQLSAFAPIHSGTDNDRGMTSQQQALKAAFLHQLGQMTEGSTTSIKLPITAELRKATQPKKISAEETEKLTSNLFG